ncbi:DUF6894 family protein [Croceibacterium xixiisoli]|uniref:DUF6894 family protein n=1 Tax=Croceibacterium xixiisoli TaxID=1476466 RepID=UPI001370E03D|nr:hypothetical protein [Croceibacterium xixiisoli]
MPFYNFEVRTPTHVMLTEGAELADSTAARVEAAKRTGQLLTEHAGELWVDQEWQMDVTNAEGLILYMLQISAFRSAAVDQTR